MVDTERTRGGNSGDVFARCNLAMALATTTKSRWIPRWDPEDDRFWADQGRRIARRNLIWSMYAEHVGFCVWVLWTVVVLNLGNAGIALSVSELFLLTLVPNLVGSLLRVPYTFAVPRFGGRAWTTISAALLFIPTLLLAFVVPSGWLAQQSHDTQLWVLILCAATAGFGGGNFSSSMANISFFYPEREKGLALGLNAAGGNLGVAVAQLVVPLVIIVSVPAAAVEMSPHPVHLAYAGLMWLPFIALAVIGAWWRMDSLTAAKTDSSSYRAAVRHRHTWIVSLLYIGTFGTFIGFSFAFLLVIKTTFPAFLADHPFIATYLAGLGFLGALVGSLSRPLGGWIADRVGGAKVTFVAFLAMVASTGVSIVAVERRSFLLFLASFVAVFFLAGVGNGSTYKMIPSIFAALARREQAEHGTDLSSTLAEYRRQAAAVIGIAGAIGAFGGVLIQVVLRQASLSASNLVAAAPTAQAKQAVAIAHSDWSVPALWIFLVSYLVLAGVTWSAYLRSRLAREMVTGPTPARALAGATT
jgi:NNP family nitrate/nitrite transporter-like MFS transporter